MTFILTFRSSRICLFLSTICLKVSPVLPPLCSSSGSQPAVAPLSRAAHLPSPPLCSLYLAHPLSLHPVKGSAFLFCPCLPWVSFHACVAVCLMRLLVGGSLKMDHLQLIVWQYTNTESSSKGRLSSPQRSDLRNPVIHEETKHNSLFWSTSLKSCLTKYSTEWAFKRFSGCSGFIWVVVMQLCV